MRVSRVVLVARENLRDTFRERGALRAMIIVPLIVWLVIGLGPVLAASSSENRDTNLRATLLVPLDTPRALVRLLDDQLRVRLSEDPEQELTLSRGDAVMEFASGAAAALQLGSEVRVREVTSDRSKGPMTIGIAESELTAGAVRLRGGSQVTQHVTGIDVRDPTEARSLLARSMPMFYVILLGAIVQIAASRFMSGRSLRTLEMLLVRPFRRRELLAGLAAYVSVLGLLSSAIIIVPFTALGLAAASGDNSGNVAATAAVLATLVVALCALFSGLGLAVGVSGKSLSATQARTGLVFVLLIAISFAVQFSGTVAKTSWLEWAPLTGVLILIRSTLATGPTIVALVRALLVTAATSAALFAYAGHYLDSERVTTRA